MNKLEEQVQENLDAVLSKKHESIVIGVSGGVDSMVLLNIVYRLSEYNYLSKQQIVVAHFNHHLREESEQEATAIMEYAESLGLVYFAGHWQQQNKISENTARNARYKFFADVLQATDSRILLTGHHQDDNAETMIMRMIRGTSLKGIQGMTEHSMRYLQASNTDIIAVNVSRPFLTIAKSDLYHYAVQNKIPFFEDQTNYQDTYLRNRIRLDILPMLERENPRIKETLEDLSQSLTISYQAHLENYQYYEPQIVSSIQKYEWIISISDYLKLSKNMRRIFLQLFFEERLVDVVPSYHRDLVEQLSYLLEQHTAPHASLALGNGYYAQREYDYLYISKKMNNTLAESEDIEIHLTELNKWYSISDNERVAIFHAHHVTSALSSQAETTFGLGLDLTNELPFIIRHRRNGDRIRLGNEEHIFHKKISRIMIDNKVPQRERNRRWLITLQNEEIIAMLPEVIANHPVVEPTKEAKYIFLYTIN
ncbi:tRNA lysidine(34) synthetase TilS [Aerococcaceae bacterium DSM 111020]|nr:tRNA lysidine(34) synthetase TilS [Aerococcaceae bacterium DSM 111020]